MKLFQNQTDYRSEFSRGVGSSRQRILLGVVGLLAAYIGLRRRGPLGLVLGLGGFWSILRASSNLAKTEAFGYLTHPVIRIRRQILVQAPVEAVYQFWSEFSNFSLFMSYVHEVDVNQNGNTTWTVAGPARLPIHWDSEVFELIPGRSIAWRTLPGASIHNSGIVRLREVGPRHITQVDIELAYAPIAGVFGYGLIKLLGFDPRETIDRDLQKMKGLIEAEFGNVPVRKLSF